MNLDVDSFVLHPVEGGSMLLQPHVSIYGYMHQILYQNIMGQTVFDIRVSPDEYSYMMEFISELYTMKFIAKIQNPGYKNISMDLGGRVDKTTLDAEISDDNYLTFSVIYERKPKVVTHIPIYEVEAMLDFYEFGG